MNHAEVFAQYRTYLFTLARRMSGSVMDAEDLLQETFIRWLQASLREIKSPKAFLTTILTNLYLNHLQSARVRKEEGAATEMSERLVSKNLCDPIIEASLSDSLSQALWILLERLSPPERLIFLLREVFDYDYEEIATIVSKSVANCRQMLCRAKHRLTSSRQFFVASPEQHEKLLRQFMQTCASGDLESLISLLDESEAFNPN